MTYEHTQNAPNWVVVLASIYAILMFSVAVALARSDDGSPVVALIVIGGVMVIYLVVLGATRLTTRVDSSRVELWFRFGWPRKSIDRAAIVDAEAHRNTWLAGWGIRKVVGGWMWNVYGLDSVQLRLDSGRTFRIGTNDVDGLLAALER